MAIMTYFAISFGRSPSGHLCPLQSRDCDTKADALQQAEVYGEAEVGAIAMSRLLDLDRGTSRPQLLHRVGETPDLGYLLAS